MNRKSNICAFFFLFLLLKTTILFGQKSKGGIPLSISQKWGYDKPAFIVPKPDWTKVRDEDKTFENPRIALPIAVDIDPNKQGEWRITNDIRLWRLKITANEAQGIGLAFDNFELPKGARFFLLSADGTKRLGAYTAENNSENHQFFIGILRGAEAIIEYSEPQNAPKSRPFHINTVYHAYQMASSDFGESLPCHININCTQGADYQDQKRGVVRILVNTEGGLYWCTGTLVNNTQQDGKPYILSAFHCLNGKTPNYNLFTFYLNYEAVGCTNPTNEPLIQSIQGCTFKAQHDQTDFLLLEAIPIIPNDFNAYLNGWNRDSLNIPTGKNVLINHPNGDIKKITIDNHTPTIENAYTNWGNIVTLPKTHLRNVYEEGTVEAGSSGAPLFDSNKRIIAYLHGAAPNEIEPCKPFYGLSGWFAKAWDGGGSANTRLKDWLDPLSMGSLTLNGINKPQPTTAKVSGVVKFWNGKPMQDVLVIMNGQTQTTDINGTYTFTNIPLNQAVSINISKTDTYENGIDGADIILLRRHILDITPFTQPRLFAADVNNDNQANGTDLILLRRLTLTINTSFPAQPWRFRRAETALSPAFPQGATESYPLSVTFVADNLNYDFYGYKTGDVNGNANIGQ